MSQRWSLDNPINIAKIDPEMKKILASLNSVYTATQLLVSESNEIERRIGLERAKHKENIARAVALLQEGNTSGDIILDYFLRTGSSDLLLSGANAIGVMCTYDAYECYEQLAARIKANIGKPILTMKMNDPEGIHDDRKIFAAPYRQHNNVNFDIRLGSVASGDLKLECGARSSRLYVQVANLFKVAMYKAYLQEEDLPQDGLRIYMPHYTFFGRRLSIHHRLNENVVYTYVGIEEIRQFIDGHLAKCWRDGLVSQLEAWLDTYAAESNVLPADQGKK